MATMAILLLTILVRPAAAAIGDCVNVETSEGIRTLPNGGRACAPLLDSETFADKGKRFITCSSGFVVTQSCGDLRFDTVYQVCYYPNENTCYLPGGTATTNTVTSSTTTTTPIITTTTTTTTTLPTTTTTILSPTTTTTTTSSTTTTTPTIEESPDTPSTESPTTTTTSTPELTITTAEPTTTTSSTATPTTTTTITTTPITTPTTTTTSSATTTPDYNAVCSLNNCQLPNCFCHGGDITAATGIPLSDTPMFIMLTFDDAVTGQVYNPYFKPLLIDNTYNLFNPNGCKIKAAFYLSDQYTEYGKVKTLALAGNEIASHTITHSLPDGSSDSDYQGVVDEIDGLRQIVFIQTGGNATIRDSITGFRSPYLRLAYNVQFDVLRDYNFLYDSSISNVEIYSKRSPLWPFTLDYKVLQCPNLPCPTKSYPGLWEVPINGWIGSNGYSCSLIDGCSVGENVFTASKAEWYTFYSDNFSKYFYPKRVPMQMFTHAAMFIRSGNSYPAMVDWFSDLLQSHHDVWLVTPQQVIQWMKNPLTNAQMIAQNWGC